MPPVKRRICPDAPFGLGLRLSHAAARELSRPEAMAEFGDFLRREHLYVFTINGFPYGQFHAGAVKENVYAPDWQTCDRGRYTMQLIDILAELLPPNVRGSISTVHGSYKTWISGKEQVREMARQIGHAAAHAG